MNVEGKTVILVDDGLATGSTVKAALKFLKRLHPASVCVAVPVAPSDTVEELRKSGDCDNVVTVLEPFPFNAVGQFYDKFDQTEDDEVLTLLGIGRKKEE